MLYTVHFIIKMAFLTFYLRLSPQANFRWGVYCGVALNVAIYLASMSVCPSSLRMIGHMC